MILKGNQRAGGVQLARHLLNDRDNDHVTVHNLRGFISDDLNGAFTEAYAVSQGTRCKQFLFSLSLNPPENARVPIDVFEAAIEKTEKRLGLSDQPRVIVFHEKEGRRHAHCVWSRIDTAQMKAINLPHYKMKLHDISRDLFLEHDWKIPKGFLNKEERNPLNFSLAEWQKAKRFKQDPKFTKALIQDCWKISDSASSFSNALKERGFFLARGDKRGHVIVSWRGEIFSVSRTIGIKTNAVMAKLGNPETLPTVDGVRKLLAEKVTVKTQEFSEQLSSTYNKAKLALDTKRYSLIKEFRAERQRLKMRLRDRKTEETRKRALRLPTGLKALWFRVTGKYKAIKLQNEAECSMSKSRDQLEMQKLVERQLTERRQLQHEYQVLRQHHAIKLAKLNREIGDPLNSSQSDKDETFRRKSHLLSNLRHR